MDTTITLNLSESEYKALTVVCKALRTTPEQVVRASAKKLFENPMDFMFEAFSSDGMGFQATEGKPSLQTSATATTPATPVVVPSAPKTECKPVAKTVAKPEVPAEPVKPKAESEKPAKGAGRLPGMTVAELKTQETAFLQYIEAHPMCSIKELFSTIDGMEKYDYESSYKMFSYYLAQLKTAGIIVHHKEGNTVKLTLPKKVVGQNPLNADIILSASGKYRKDFYLMLANNKSKSVTVGKLSEIFENEGYDKESVEPAINSALDRLVEKKNIALGRGREIIVTDKFRHKVWRTYPEADKPLTPPTRTVHTHT